MNSATLIKAVSVQGPAWALKRLRFELSARSGMLALRTPVRPWSDFPLDRVLAPGIPLEPGHYFNWRSHNRPAFFFTDVSALRAGIGSRAAEIGDGILRGEFPFFGQTRQLSFPPEWRTHPLSGAATPDAHWSRIDEFSAEDVKLVWELSRFNWVFPLARAFVATGGECYAEAFWQLFEDWLERNPPNRGIQWKCGQETALRALALCFASCVFATAPSTTPARLAALVSALPAHARRIEAHIAYALSQKNNHALSEAASLWTIGLLFPELRASSRWRERGREVLESEVRRQIYADGAYVQHSANYHRLMLQLLAWCLILGERNGESFSPELRDSFDRATRFLCALTDRTSGWAPNYGANDGAHLLPLSDCGFPDMRPVLQSCHFLTRKARLFPPGPWDEEMAWLHGMESLHAPPDADCPVQLDAPEGGCYTLRSSNSWAMLRASRFRDRPSHADQLHLDLWYKGKNFLCDPGTYSYNAPPPFEHAFASTRFHNTVTVDGADQMTRASRFLWVDWSTAAVRRYRLAKAQAGALEGEHDGYRRSGVQHRRAVAALDRDIWIVVDDLTGRGEHSLALQWLLADARLDTPDQSSTPQFILGDMRIFVSCSVPAVFDLMRAGHRLCGTRDPAPDESRGWISRDYARLEPALSLLVASSGVLPVRFVTVISPSSAPEPRISAALDWIQADAQSVPLGPIGSSAVFAAAQS